MPWKGIFTLLQDQDKAGTVDSAEESLPSAVNTQVFVTERCHLILIIIIFVTFPLSSNTILFW